MEKLRYSQPLSYLNFQSLKKPQHNFYGLQNIWKIESIKLLYCTFRLWLLKTLNVTVIKKITSPTSQFDHASLVK